MSDLREEIALKLGLCNCGDEYKNRRLTAPDCPYHAFAVAEAMDEYFTERAMELLGYMADNKITCYRNKDNEFVFYIPRKGINSQYLSKEQLFENFL